MGKVYLDNINKVTYKNRKFKVFGTEYRIKFKDSVYIDDEWVYGLTTFKSRVIEISLNNADGERLPNRVIDNTILHELVHVICEEGAYSQYTVDEPFIEWAAKCLLSFLEQKLL